MARIVPVNDMPTTENKWKEVVDRALELESKFKDETDPNKLEVVAEDLDDDEEPAVARQTIYRFGRDPSTNNQRLSTSLRGRVIYVFPTAFKEMLRSRR